MKPKTTALRPFALLWATQAFSALGSAMTNFALIIWTYEQRGSALTTALLSVCSYAPYVLASIFAGTLSDRWKKKAILIVSDGFSALCTVAVLLLLKTGSLEFWHLYLLNALSGLMNTVQQPASAVAVSGTIGWVGLVIPHFCRMLFGYDYRRLIPAAALFGAAFLLAVDDIARLVTTGELPLGILTAFVGAPLFLYLIITGGRRHEH